MAPTTEAGKAQARICRKVIQAKLSGSSEIEIWGDGRQTATFMYIDDCLKGVQMILARHHRADQPGSSERVTINDWWTLSSEIAGIKLKRPYNLTAPKVSTAETATTP